VTDPAPAFQRFSTFTNDFPKQFLILRFYRDIGSSSADIVSISCGHQSPGPDPRHLRSSGFSVRKISPFFFVFSVLMLSFQESIDISRTRKENRNRHLRMLTKKPSVIIIRLPSTGPIGNVLEERREEHLIGGSITSSGGIFQKSQRVKAGLDYFFKRTAETAAPSLSAAKKKENDRIQTMINMREETKRKEISLLHKKLKLNERGLDASLIIKTEFSKRGTSCATKKIAEAHAAAYRPLIRNPASINAKQNYDPPVDIKQATGRSSKPLTSPSGFSKLQVKAHPRSLAHNCGFESFTLLR
jgi:hypothetical protein